MQFERFDGSVTGLLTKEQAHKLAFETRDTVLTLGGWDAGVNSQVGLFGLLDAYNAAMDEIDQLQKERNAYETALAEANTIIAWEYGEDARVDVEVKS